MDRSNPPVGHIRPTTGVSTDQTISEFQSDRSLHIASNFGGQQSISNNSGGGWPPMIRRRRTATRCPCSRLRRPTRTRTLPRRRQTLDMPGGRRAGQAYPRDVRTPDRLDRRPRFQRQSGSSAADGAVRRFADAELLPAG